MKTYKSAASAMKSRINLQTIGTYLRDGASKTQISSTSFEKRENIAFSKLEQQVAELCGAEKKDEILDCIWQYCSTLEEIYFSLGMKAGATLQVKLLDNFETDV